MVPRFGNICSNMSLCPINISSWCRHKTDVIVVYKTNTCKKKSIRSLLLKKKTKIVMYKKKKRRKIAKLDIQLKQTQGRQACGCFGSDAWLEWQKYLGSVEVDVVVIIIVSRLLPLLSLSSVFSLWCPALCLHACTRIVVNGNITILGLIGLARGQTGTEMLISI